MGARVLHEDAPGCDRFTATIGRRMPEQHQIQIALEGVVRLLSQNLYADPDVFLREMIQNAQDSIVKRRLREPHAGRIELVARVIDSSLTIEDDGIGLTRDDIHGYLSTIGRSGTGELKQRLRHGDVGEAAALIGQFGIGLLSAFMVADRVEVHTRHPDDDAWRWSFDGGTRYELSPGDRISIGTSVTLSLKPACAGYVEHARLAELVRRFAELVPIPIHLGGSAMPINAMRAPWDGGADSIDAGAAGRFLERRFPNERVLSWVRIDEPIGGARLRGLLAITDRPAELGRARIALYVSRMFVGDQHAELLPSWAAFVRGVVECDALVPVAARDRVLVDDSLRAAAQAIERTIIDHLRALASSERDRLVAILRIHATAIMGMLLEGDEPELFTSLAPMIPLRTNMGPMTIPEAVAANPDGVRLRFTTQRQPSSAVRTLCDARGLVLLELGEAYAERFVHDYARTWPDRLLPLRADEVGGGELIAALPLGERMQWRRLEVLAASMAGHDRVELARFLPAELPALRLDTAKGRGQRELHGVVSHLGMPSFLHNALAGALAQPIERGVIYLNVAHPVIAALADPAQDDRRVAAVTRVVLDLTALVSDAPLDHRARIELLRGTSLALQTLLETSS
jgi:molecular chaperone HtpG